MLRHNYCANKYPGFTYLLIIVILVSYFCEISQLCILNNFNLTVIIDDLEIMKEMHCSENFSDRYTDGWVLQRSFGKHLGSFAVIAITRNLPRHNQKLTVNYFGKINNKGILFGRGEEWKEIRRFSLR